MPPCCTTSIWPRPAIASTAATGSIPDSDVTETLAGSSSALTANSRIVAAPMVSSPLDRETCVLFR